MKHYPQIEHLKSKIRKLKQERDEMFSVVDVVSHDEQVYLLNAMLEITDEINDYKKQLEVLIHENN